MQVQVLLSAPKQTKTNRIISVRFFISWLATGLVTMQGIVCTLRAPLHSVQLSQRFASKLARLCYYARFVHYKSCCPHQKKTIRKGCLFSCDSGLETKLRFVGKRHCVCLPLHAADAPLGNNIALLMLLRSLRSLQVLLSAPNKNKTNRNYSVRFFISLVCNRTCDNAGHSCLNKATGVKKIINIFWDRLFLLKENLC